MIENNTDSIYSNFPKVSSLSNRDYMSSAYGTKQKVQYYNDPEQTKRKKRKYIATMALIGITSIGTLIAAFGYRKGKFNPEQIKATAQKVQTTIEEKGIAEKFSNAMGNIVNLKDDIWDKFVTKLEATPFGKPLRKFNNSTTDFNKYKLVKPSCKAEYNKACGNLAQFSKNGEKFEEFEKLFESLDNSLNEALHKKNNRISDNMFEKGFSGFIDKFTSNNIADTKINSLEAVKNAYKYAPEGASAEYKKAIDEYNETIHTIISKLRDINCGSAPTDYMTMIGSASALGVAAISADDKKERRSILVELGIPLLSTLGCSFVANAKLLSGAVGLLVGFTVGKTASAAAALGMKKYDKFMNSLSQNQNQDQNQKNI